MVGFSLCIIFYKKKTSGNTKREVVKNDERMEEGSKWSEIHLSFRLSLGHLLS